jgi:hypothetical protein
MCSTSDTLRSARRGDIRDIAVRLRETGSI